MQIATKLEAATLVGLPQRHWPKASLVDAMQFEVNKQKRLGVKSPFLYQDIKKWQAEWALAAQNDETPERQEVSKELLQIAEARASACLFHVHKYNCFAC